MNVIKKVTKKQKPPVGENKICDVSRTEIRADIDNYYFVRDEQRRGKFVCLECKNRFYSNK